MLAAIGTNDDGLMHGGKKKQTCEDMVGLTPVDDIVEDTGCSRTMVRAALLPEAKVSMTKMVTIWCAHGQV